MHIASRITRRRSSLHATLALAGAAVMIIMGLLGMHTFNSEAAGHGAAGPAATASTVHHSSSMGAPSGAGHGSPCDDTCVTGSGGEHSDMMSACVLALLAGLLLFFRPLLVRRIGPSLQMLVASLRLPAGRALPRPPSLTLLSISRT